MNQTLPPDYLWVREKIERNAEIGKIKPRTIDFEKLKKISKNTIHLFDLAKDEPLTENSRRKTSPS